MMGKAARLRRREQEAAFGVFCPGMLEVLSIGKGDLKITLSDTGEGKEEARRLIEEMLRKGYSIFVETKDYGPVKVNRFDPKEMTYIIVEPAPETADSVPPVTMKPRGHPKGTPNPSKGKPRERRVLVAGSKATAVGRTAGG